MTGTTGPGGDRPPPPAPAGVRPRLAGAIAVAVGGVAALAGFIAAPSAAPWWMPLLLFAVAAAIVWRLLRPQPRLPRWEDEI